MMPSDLVTAPSSSSPSPSPAIDYDHQTQFLPSISSRSLIPSFPNRILRISHRLDLLNCPRNLKNQKQGRTNQDRTSKSVSSFYGSARTYRNTLEVDKIINEDLVFEKKENPSAEEIEANEKWWERFRASPVVQFMARAEEIADDMNKIGHSLSEEDKEIWRAAPHVPGFDRRPMPRKAIKSKEESDDKLWDFMKQFLFLTHGVDL